MIYTKEQLGVMSDFEINRELAVLQGFEPHGYDFDGIVTMSKGLKTTTFDYREWNDIMLLVVKYKISLTTTDRGITWWAGHDMSICENTFITCCNTDYQDKSPQRAIACCLLMLDLGENK